MRPGWPEPPCAVPGGNGLLAEAPPDNEVVFAWRLVMFQRDLFAREVSRIPRGMAFRSGGGLFRADWARHRMAGRAHSGGARSHSGRNLASVRAGGKSIERPDFDRVGPGPDESREDLSRIGRNDEMAIEVSRFG